jgi:hypothetical protein
MKWQRSLLVILLTSSIFVACSDNGNNDTTTSTQAATTNTPAPSTETLKSDAKEKRSDAAVQRLKGKIQMMTESVYPGENTKILSLKNVFKYDANGNRLELASYKSDGGLVSNIKSAYDSAGKVVSEETVLSNGTVDIKTQIKTDDKGNRVEQINLKQGLAPNNILNNKYVYKYDEKAHMLEWNAFRGNGSFFFKYSYNYDANGNRTEWIHLSQANEVTLRLVYKYDDKNNIIEETDYNRDGTVKAAYTYTYEFDKKGNWVKQKKIQNGSVVEVRTREYKYY